MYPLVYFSLGKSQYVVWGVVAYDYGAHFRLKNGLVKLFDP